jgi:hypothetical protein
VIRAALLVASLAACDHRATVTACDDVLTGAYATDDPTAPRWMILDHGRTLEAYPLTADAAPDPAHPDLVVAPRHLELRRDGATVSGELRRRYTRGATSCEARAPLRLIACGHDTLEVERGAVVAPLTVAGCAWPPPATPRRERWRREP